MRRDLESRAKAAVEAYTERTVHSVSVVADPDVAGTYAVRAKIDYVDGAPPQSDDFIWTPRANGPFPGDDIEEVEFTTWPPTPSRPMASRQEKPPPICRHCELPGPECDCEPCGDFA